jgi:dihydroxyacetone kinase
MNQAAAGRVLRGHRRAHQIVETILADLPFRRGDESGMLMNGLRSTLLTELCIVFRKTAQMLDTAVFLAEVDGGTAA